MKKYTLIISFFMLINSVFSQTTTFLGSINIIAYPLTITDSKGNLMGYIDQGVIGTGPGKVTTGLRMFTDLSGMTTDNYYQFAQPSGNLNLNCDLITSPLLNQWFQNDNGRIALTKNIPNIKVYSIKGVDGTVPGVYTIMTTPAPSSGVGDFIITNIKFVIRSMSGVIVSEPIVNIGTAMPMFNDIANRTSTTYMSKGPLLNTTYQCQFYTNYSVLPYGASLKLNIVSPSSGCTSFIFDTYLEGFYTN